MRVVGLPEGEGGALLSVPCTIEAQGSAFGTGGREAPIHAFCAGSLVVGLVISMISMIGVLIMMLVMHVWAEQQQRYRALAPPGPRVAHL
jgi:hypothetical protein